MTATYEQPELSRRRAAVEESLRSAGVAASGAPSLAEESMRRRRLSAARARQLLSLPAVESYKALRALERSGLIRKDKTATAIRESFGRAWSSYTFSFEEANRRAYASALVGIKELDASITENKPDFLEKRPWVYLDYKSDLDLLSGWLKGSWGSRKDPVSEAERWYEIWGNEKMLLDARRGRAGLSQLLNRLGFDRSHLACYSTAETRFLDYLLPGARSIAVSENLDFFHALRAILRRHGKVKLAGREIDGCIFGSGWSSTGQEFSVFVQDIGASSASYAYIGDIDEAGIAIASRFVETRPASLFRELYREMARLHVERRASGLPVNRFEENQNCHIDLDSFTSWMSQSEAAEVRRCIAERTRIPQEILTAAMLERMVEKIGR